jgi:hypothetical protein
MREKTLEHRGLPFEGGGGAEDDEGIPSALASSPIDDITQQVDVQDEPKIIYILGRLQDHVPSYWNNR